MATAARAALIAWLSLGLAACAVGRGPRAAVSPAAAYWCPMHPDVRGHAGERCPKCQMELVPASTVIGDAYAVDVELNPRLVAPRQKTRVRLHVREPGTGATVKRFDVVHEKVFHLFVISRDLEYFTHVHPVLRADGALDVDIELPRAGLYQLVADFVPAGGPPQVVQKSIITAGHEGPLLGDLVLTADTDDKVIAGTRVRLGMREAMAGGQRLMTFELLDEASGRPASGLEPYLGATGHLVLMSADMSVASHSHPVAERAALPSSVAFQVLFPRAGTYRVWVQFQRSGKVMTASFTIPVQDRYRTGT
ncbi:MAG: heavy metal-binding domain-containing protein [Vicinamibacterales bacterium]